MAVLILSERIPMTEKKSNAILAAVILVLQIRVTYILNVFFSNSSYDYINYHIDAK